MLRKFTALVIAALLGNGFAAYAQTPSPKEFKIKQQIVEYGTEQNVKIKLKSEEVLKGRIAEIKNDSFTLQVVDLNGQVIDRTLAYSELSKVSKVGVGENRKALRRGLLQGAGAMAAAIGTMLIITLIARAAID